MERAYTVEGMTCDHCVAAVEEEVGAVPGVAGVTADLATERVIVTGEGVEDAAVRAAIDEAGYVAA